MGRLAVAALILAAFPRPVARAAEPAADGQRRTAAPAVAGLGHAGQGFVVAPTRVVFEDRRRHATLTLANTGSEPAAYRVSLVRMRMSPTGEITPVVVPEPGEAFADSLVRFSPRQFEVAPQSFQVVRLQLRAPAGLPDGEYRSHLLIQEIPRPAPSADAPASAESGIQIRLTPVFGTAIPVIVRQGATSAQVSFADFQYQSAGSPGGRPSLSFKLVRDGHRSVYGDVECLAVRPGRRARAIGALKGIAVYTPNRERRVDIPLESDPVAKGEMLRVRFSETSLDAGATAESTLVTR
jgi:hypothetical protein